MAQEITATQKVNACVWWRLTEMGGPWERALGGTLILSLPQASAFDAEREFERQIAQYGG
jgi:hypothetical protein